MRKLLLYSILACLAISCFPAGAQAPIDDETFFLDTAMLDVTIATDLKRLGRKNFGDDTLDALFTCVLPDGTSVREKVGLTLRGHLRLDICGMPPVKVHFEKSDSSRMYKLKTLKLVNACRDNSTYGQWLLKEYLAYRIYNEVTDKSFRVRLLTITYEDAVGKKKSSDNFAFLIEDVDEMAKRNQCRELNVDKMRTVDCDRQQFVRFCLFQYMIGNTDWAIQNLHNIKVIVPRADSTAKPYVVPYDFDYAGLVDAYYAVPDPNLGIEKVTERVYRGFPLTEDEISSELAVFISKKDRIYSMVRDCPWLDKRTSVEMINYLDAFYQVAEDPNRARFAFNYNVAK